MPYKDPQKNRECKRLWARTAAGKASNDKYRASPEWGETRARTLRLYRERKPLQATAVQAANNAIRDGRLERELCWVCGDAAQAHHSSYDADMRLVVTWLCGTHHAQLHREFRAYIRRTRSA